MSFEAAMESVTNLVIAVVLLAFSYASKHVESD